MRVIILKVLLCISALGHNLLVTSLQTYLLGYFDRRDQPEYNIFRRVATNVKDDCLFYVGFDEASRTMHPAGQPIIVFRPDRERSNDLDETYTGSLKNFDELHIWVSEKCVPLVREITFENAEELTEEGLPFLILFHSPDDKESIKRFTEIVQTDLLSEKRNNWSRLSVTL
jgi:endoplasmic reticulum resident protein 44